MCFTDTSTLTSLSSILSSYAEPKNKSVRKIRQSFVKILTLNLYKCQNVSSHVVFIAYHYTQYFDLYNVYVIYNYDVCNVFTWRKRKTRLLVLENMWCNYNMCVQMYYEHRMLYVYVDIYIYI